MGNPFSFSCRIDDRDFDVYVTKTETDGYSFEIIPYRGPTLSILWNPDTQYFGYHHNNHQDAYSEKFYIQIVSTFISRSRLPFAPAEVAFFTKQQGRSAGS